MSYDPLPPTKGFMTVHIPTPEPQSKDSDDDVHDVIAAAAPPRAAPGPLKIKLSLSKQTPAANAGWSRSADSSPAPPPLNPPKRLVLSLKPSASAATGTGTGAAISTVVPQPDRCAHDASPEPPIKMTAVEMGGTAVATAASSSTPAPGSVFGGSPPRGPTPMEGYASAYGAPLSYQQQQPQASSVPGSTVRPNADAFPASPMDRRGTPEPYAPSAAGAGVLWAPSNNNLGSSSSTINRNPALVPLDPLPLMRVTATIQAKYELHRKLGEGTYGEVYEGFDKSTRAKVAVKKFKVLDHVEGIPTTTIREITILRSLTQQRCENITALRDVIVSANFDELYLVFDFVEHSLYGLLACRVRLNHDDYRCIARQVLLGLVTLHREHIVHRDLKLNNILVDSRGCVKLCDFGLAFSTTSHRARVTPSLVSLPYRPPEMLFNRASYNEAVDVWAFGCLLAQLFIGGMPPFMLKGGHPAATELEQLALISQAFDCSPWDLLHPATLKQCHPMWAKDSGADNQQAKKTPQGSSLIAHLNGICRERNRPLLPVDVAEIIVRALAPDPTDRPTSEQLNQHPWFTLQNPSLEMAQLAKRIREGAGDRFCHNAPRADGGGA